MRREASRRRCSSQGNKKIHLRVIGASASARKFVRATWGMQTWRAVNAVIPNTSPVTFGGWLAGEDGDEWPARHQLPSDARMRLLLSIAPKYERGSREDACQRGPSRARGLVWRAMYVDYVAQ